MSERAPEIAAALLQLPHDHVAEPHRSWLRDQYRRVVPVVLVDALRAAEDGSPLPPRCVARLRELAADCSETEVPLAVSLRATLPAVRVFCGFVQETADGARAAQLVERGCVVAQEVISTWVEAWVRARSTRAARPTAPPEPGGDEELEPVDEVMLALVAEGRSNEEIAAATHYSRQAVGWRLSRLMHRWRVSNRAALTATAYAKGILVPPRRHP
ncbi:LuxR C-terminal-related transcriptional regulator [Quadrisphaera sp. DSM 44207]|uniref:helix-turn-helix transcriptional regulator n=1 Tax=Quadrisphaera sp. DSM 44207 TaxID=1881057 RepID=UPI0008908223|nr:LuxR C-terminal-related transcriptional regulator [Quadrisphaera sp. DSM 44207]SDQ35500.1 regulatory protein, luxR family [Quadrisphaera sp. DSM 44207]